MGDHLRGDEIIDLIHDLVVDPARAQYLEHVARCRSCAELVRRRSAEMETARARASAAVRHRRPRRGLRPRFLWISLAAVAAAAALALFLVAPPRPSSPLEYTLPGPAVLTTLRSENEDLPVLEAALEDYARHRATAVIERLGPVEFHEPVESLRRIYLASALVEAGRPRRAIATLDAMDVSTLPEPWRGHAQAVLFVACRADGQAERARATLGELMQRTDSLGDLARRWHRRR
jgi:hypothetical protein